MKPGSIARRYYQPVPTEPPENFGIRAASPPHQDWKSQLPSLLKTADGTRSKHFNDLIGEFFNDPTAKPNEDELNAFVGECMAHAETKVLTAILAQESPKSLRITHRVDLTGWTTLLEAMPDGSQIKDLYLFNQHFDSRNTDLFHSCLGRMPRLQSLSFNCCILNTGLLRLPSLPALESLHFENAGPSYGLLMHALESSPLATLRLDGCLAADREVHPDIAAALGKQDKLRELALRNLSDDSDLDTLLGAYAKHFLAKQTRLENLDLSGSRLRPTHYDLLSKVLQDKPALTSLSLARCWLERERPYDGTHLARLIQLKSLVNLDLSFNPLFDADTPAVMALISHPTLQKLDLHNVTMTQETCDLLPEILVHCRTLVSLRLVALADNAYAPWVKAMESNSSLRHLSIPGLDLVRSLMEKRFPETYPTYLSFMESVQRNQTLFAQKVAEESAEGTVTPPGQDEVLKLEEDLRKEAVAEQERLRHDKH